MARLALELTKDSQQGLLRWYADINFLHFAILLFAVCSAVLVVVSLAGRPPDEGQLAGLTFATARAPHAGARGEARRSASDPLWRRRDVWLSIALAVCVILVWLYFSG